jgi:hypothetical protein
MSNKYYDYHLYALASIDKLALINNDTKWLYKLEKIAIDNPIKTLKSSESIINFDEKWYNILYKKIINNKNRIEQQAASKPRNALHIANKIAKIDNA